jgi:hypothetical protein
MRFAHPLQQVEDLLDGGIDDNNDKVLMYENFIQLAHYLKLKPKYNDMIYFNIYDILNPKIFSIGDTILNTFEIINDDNYVEDINKLRQNLFLGEINVDDSMFIDVFKSDNSLKRIFLKDLNIEENIKFLLENSKPSPFGFKTQTLYDTEVRSAKELKYANNEFNINFLPSIFKRTRMNMVLDKLNIYSINDHFKVHLDTNKKNLIETLVVVLPSKFEGGELFFPNIKYNFNGPFDLNKMYFIIFPYYYPHEIKKILCGNRITLTFNVFKEEVFSFTQPYDLQPIVENNNSSSYNLLHKIFNGKKNIVMSDGYKYRMFYLNFFKSEKYKEFYDIQTFYTFCSKVKYDTPLYGNINLNPDYEDPPGLYGNIVLPRLIINDKGDRIEDTYRYTYGYAGNEACSSRCNIKYSEFYVINPEYFDNSLGVYEENEDYED